MFALRNLTSNLPKSSLVRVRGNATLSTSLPPPNQTRQEAESLSSNAPIHTKTRGRRSWKLAHRRPNISLDTPRLWCPALRPGVVPAYDLALNLLKRDSHKLKSEAQLLRSQIDAKEAEYQALKAELKNTHEKDSRSKLDVLDRELEEMLKTLDIVEVQSEINLPSVRWTVSNAMADMRRTSHRYLLEQKWRKDGALDLLMERIYQMKVVPDVLPELNPSFDLQVIVRSTNWTQKIVEPGDFLEPKLTMEPPKLRAKVFHTDTRLYTMLLVDPDVPNPETQSFTTYLHWLKPNVELSATTPPLIPELNTHTRYIPPHPQSGTRYHRYVCLFLPQPPIGASDYTLTVAKRMSGPTSTYLDIPIVPDEDRLGFDVREFVRRWNLNGSNGGGAHMWREKYSRAVSMIYKRVLKTEEPHYGRPPKMDVYAHARQKKYVS